MVLGFGLWGKDFQTDGILVRQNLHKEDLAKSAYQFMLFSKTNIKIMKEPVLLSHA